MTRWGPTHSPDYRWLMAVIVAVCAAGAGSAIWPVVEHVIGAAVVGVPLVAGVVWGVRREARIRRRLADTAGGLGRRVGPGVPSPTAPAPTSTSTSTSTSRDEVPRAAAAAGATTTRGALS